MNPIDSVELDNASLQHVFCFLSRNHLVLSVKPVNRHFKEFVQRQQQGKSNQVAASDEVPLWALPSLEVASLAYKQKKQLMAAAAKGVHLLTLKWARQQGLPWDRTISDAAAEGGHLRK